jgi:flagellar basal-body rod protein FlgB
MSNNIKLLEKVLDYSALKQKVIGKNIANATTVGYKREDVDFQNVLSSVNNNLKTSEPQHIMNGSHAITGNSELKVVEEDDTENVSGFNNVDIDREMAELAENNLMFRFSSKRMTQYFQDMQSVIRGGR